MAENYAEEIKNITEHPYHEDFDTALKGGYSLRFCYDNSDQYLVLMHGIKEIDTVSGMSLGLPYKNLGAIAADFENEFVLVHSFGSGNGHPIEMIEKTSGKNLLPDGVFWVNALPEAGLLLYSKDDFVHVGDTFFVYEAAAQKTTPEQVSPKMKYKDDNRVEMQIAASREREVLIKITSDASVLTIPFKKN